MVSLNQVIQEEKNIAELLDEDELKKIGQQVVSGFDNDLMSRAGWEKDVVSYLKLAMQICEDKTYPWPGAANVKYPAISTAAMQFSARAYPSLVPANGRLVQVGITGQNNQQKNKRAQNVSEYMSYQILQEMDGWEEGMDNLLLILPIFGIAFKKVYYDSAKGTNVSELVHPFNFVVDYWTKSLDESSRTTEILYRDKRYITERQRKGIYSEVELGTPNIQENFKERMNVTKNLTPTQENDEFTPYMLLEQHTFLDLDDDGYAEPYVILVEYGSQKVLRITPRYLEEDIQYNEDGEVTDITPIGYYVKYPFIPSPDGSFYTRGFGHLLGPLNEAINTTLNQLIDAGHLSTLQAGFIGKGIKIRQGDVRFRPGEWKPVNNLGQDLKNQIVPLPAKEPSNVLFQLLNMLIQSGKELASVAEIFVGKMPGQNTPAHTTQQTIEQGMKLFTAIYKRVYRALTQEFRKLYRLNYYYFDEEDYTTVLDVQDLSREDFARKDKDIFPTADPAASSEYEAQQKVQGIGQYIQLGTVDPKTYTEWAFRAMGLSDADIKMLTEGSKANKPPQPSPEEKQMQMESQMKQADAQQKMQGEQAKMALKAKEAELALVMKQQESAMNLKHKQTNFIMDAKIKAANAKLDMQAKELQHKQKMQQAAQQKTQPKGK